MMANRHDGSSTTPDEVDGETLTTVASHIEQCLTHRAGLTRVIEELETAQLRGERIQDDLSELFRREESLAMLASLDRTGELDSLLQEIETHEVLAPGTIEEFTEWWQDIAWIAPGLDAYARDQVGAPYHWTDKDIDFDTVNGELVIEHVLQHGVDEIHRLRVPPHKLFTDSVQRLEFVLRLLPTAIEQGDINREAVERILSCQEALVEFSNILEDLKAGADPAATSESDGSGDSHDDDGAATEQVDLIGAPDPEQHEETANRGFQ